jgi:DNA-binding XRE family transcriptional regulator
MNNLKNARLAAGLTQRQVAEKLGICEQVYQKYEYGKCTPSLCKAIKTAKLLNSTVENLYPLSSQEKL